MEEKGTIPEADAWSPCDGKRFGKVASVSPLFAQGVELEGEDLDSSSQGEEAMDGAVSRDEPKVYFTRGGGGEGSHQVRAWDPCERDPGIGEGGERKGPGLGVESEDLGMEEGPLESCREREVNAELALAISDEGTQQEKIPYVDSEDAFSHGSPEGVRPQAQEKDRPRREGANLEPGH